MQLDKEEIQAALDEEIKEAEKKYGKSIKFTLINIIGLIKMLNPDQTEKKSRLIALSDWNEYHEYPTKGALRQYKYYNTDNFCDVLEYGGPNGKRLLINEDKFFEWHKKRNKKLNICP